MQKEQEIEIAGKTVTDGEKKEIKMDVTIKPETTELKEEKLDIETMKIEAEEELYVKPLVLKAEPKCKDLVNLVIEGIESGDDDDEEFVTMTPEEMRIFLEQNISEHLKDPKVNPLLALQNHSQDLLEEIKDKAEEISKIGRAIDMTYKNHEKFLRHMDIFPKVPTNSVSVSVDLPLLMDSVPLMTPSKSRNEEAVIRKDLSDAKVLSPSVTRNKSTPTFSNSVPSVPSAISITPVAQNVSAPSVSSAIQKACVSNTTSTVKSSPKLPPKPAGNIECIDLTDDTPVAVKGLTNLSPLGSLSLVKHPAPLPPKPVCASPALNPNIPPKPRLKISSEDRGIVLQWDMPPNYAPFIVYSKLKAFDIFGYQEQKNVVINTLLWKKIGSVNAMNLPMACTLTQFLEGQRYHFAIRAVDVNDRCGAYSDPISIVYKPNYTKKT